MEKSEQKDKKSVGFNIISLRWKPIEMNNEIQNPKDSILIAIGENLWKKVNKKTKNP